MLILLEFYFFKFSTGCEINTDLQKSNNQETKQN